MMEFGNMLDRAISIGTGILGKWKLWTAILGALVATHGLAYCRGGDDRERAVRAEFAASAMEARKVEDQSAGQAAGERETDRGTITDNQKDRDNAITAEPDKAPSRSRNALNCERLRQAGTDVSHLPACGGRAPGS